MLHLNSLSFINTKELSSTTDKEALIKNYIKSTKKWDYFSHRINPLFGDFENNKLKDYINKLEDVMSNFFMNSWYMCSDESAALLDICIKEGNNIMIQSTYDKLIKAFESNSTNSIWISTVNYLDYTNTILDNIDFLNLLVTKRKSFEYQNELAVITKKEFINTSTFNSQKQKKFKNGYEKNLNVNVNLDILIDSIYLSNFISDYESSIIQSQIKKIDLECKNRIITGERNMF